MIQALQRAHFDVVARTPKQSKHGAIETHEEAKRCAELFRSNGEAIEGVIVTLANFGDERAIADALRFARLSVPVLIQATPDTPGKMEITHRREGLCGRAFHTRIILDRMAQHGVYIKRVINAGGIPQKNSVLIYANVLGRPVLVPSKSVVSLGFAIFAFLATRTFKTVEEVQDKICPAHALFAPNPEAQRVYHAL